MTLPTEAKARKDIPLYRGLFKYFPDALAAVAELSRIGNEQHSPGQPLHWAKEKSTDEADALLRHMLDSGTIDTDGTRHSTKVAWRALALLQRELDALVEKTVATPPPPIEHFSYGPATAQRAIHNAETGRFAHACPDLDQEFPPGYGGWDTMDEDYGDVDPTYVAEVAFDIEGERRRQFEIVREADIPLAAGLDHEDYGDVSEHNRFSR